MAAEREEGDLFFRGVLLYKPGPLTACQKCKAELRFESKSGMKRLDLYSIHGNRKFPGSPSTTIPLMNALGVINGKQHTITRAKYTFQVMTPGEQYQLSTLTEEEKRAWLAHLDLILNHIPVDNRTYEFHVRISPTTHSDNLHLTGQYILKVTETELHLFSASGSFRSKFWTPLGAIRKAHHCLLPSSAMPPHPTKRILIITTEGSSPVGEGGFAFFTDSAKDIAATIAHRKEMRLQARSAPIEPPPLPEGEGERENSSPQHQQLTTKTSLPANQPSESNLDFTKRQRERGEQSSSRKCARQSRKIPVSHQLEKDKSQLRLHLGEGAEPQNGDHALSTPDEPTHVSVSELAKQQSEFREWKRQKEEREGRRRTGLAALSPESANTGRREGWARQRSSTISTPTPDRESRQMSSVSSIDCSYVTILRGAPGLGEGVSGENSEGVSGENSEGVSGESSEGETSLRGVWALERQRRMDVPSPCEEPEDEEPYVRMRPRTNAISVSPPKTHTMDPHQRELPLGGAREGVWECDEDSCRLRPLPPPLTTTQQKSDSDPQLSSRDTRTASDVSYLTILPPTPPGKKSPKKPKPTPRTQKPTNLPLCGPAFLKMTPPTPSSERRGLQPRLSSPHSLTRGLDMRTLLSSQRSLSESNLFSATDADTPEDDYVDMSHYRENWGQKQLYVNYNELCGNSNDPLPHGELRRQVSSSCGDLRGETEAPQPLYENTDSMYENGREAVRFYTFGCTGNYYPENEGEEEEECENEGLCGGCRGVATGPCCHGDSGLGSTPSGSPLLANQQRSFSLDDMQHPTHPARAEQPEKPPKRHKWQLRCCTKVAKGRLGHTHNKEYENLPLITSP